MRVRIIASKPRKFDPEITELIGQEFEVLEKKDDGSILAKTIFAPCGYYLYHDEYEVVEQKEAPGAVTP